MFSTKIEIRSRLTFKRVLNRGFEMILFHRCDNKLNVS